MKNILYSILWIIVPFVGTTIGASLVFFIRKNIKVEYKNTFLGFASGIMISASIWSLILPALEMTDKSIFIKCMQCALGFFTGIIFLVIINKMTQKLENKFNMLMFSVTLHNIPEGMIVGIGLAGFLLSAYNFSLSDAVIIALGIAIQNIPDGAIVSLPLKFDGKSNRYSFWMGVISGIVEPIAAILTILISNKIMPFMSYLLSFASGAMFYVVIGELIPEMCENNKKNFGIIGFAFGFLLMMTMDMCLG